MILMPENQGRFGALADENKKFYHAKYKRTPQEKWLYRLTGGYGISYRIMELFDFEIDLNDILD